MSAVGPDHNEEESRLLCRQGQCTSIRCTTGMCTTRPCTRGRYPRGSHLMAQVIIPFVLGWERTDLSPVSTEINGANKPIHRKRAAGDEREPTPPLRSRKPPATKEVLSLAEKRTHEMAREGAPGSAVRAGGGEASTGPPAKKRKTVNTTATKRGKGQDAVNEDATPAPPNMSMGKPASAAATKAKRWKK
jgi:hypothetical protein